jgi:hypothetical protein
MRPPDRPPLTRYQMPPGGGGPADALDRRRRRIEMHALTAIRATDRERDHLSAGLVPMTFSRRPSDIRRRVAGLAEDGATELVYARSGPDVMRELQAMAEAVHGWPRSRRRCPGQGFHRARRQRMVEAARYRERTESFTREAGYVQPNVGRSG